MKVPMVPPPGALTMIADHSKSLFVVEIAIKEKPERFAYIQPCQYMMVQPILTITRHYIARL